MEKMLINKHEDRLEKISLTETVEQVKSMYVEAAEKYLDEDDALRKTIIDFYSIREETGKELLNYLGKKNKDEIDEYLNLVKDFTEDQTRFIEKIEKLNELQTVHGRRREYSSADRVASDEEYELGVYADVIEVQVREAVFDLNRKGYVTFQSGFREKSDRDQFMDFRNSNLVIPDEVIEKLKESSVEIKIEYSHNRTTLTLHPTADRAIRLSEWKEIWNTLVAGLPPADSALVPRETVYEHRIFREKQDKLRASLN